MNKKLIIIAAAAGLLSFVGMFVLAWVTKSAPPEQTQQADQSTSEILSVNSTAICKFIFPESFDNNQFSALFSNV